MLHQWRQNSTYTYSSRILKKREDIRGAASGSLDKTQLQKDVALKSLPLHLRSLFTPGALWIIGRISC